MLVNASGGFYDSALETAVVRGLFDAVQLLLNRGASLSHEAFYQAISDNHVEIVQLLLNRGCCGGVQFNCFKFDS